MFRAATLLAATLFVCLTLSASGHADEWTVLSGDSNGQMMTHALVEELNELTLKRRQAFEQRTTVEQVRAHQGKLRKKFVAALGGFPQRTPLNARITGTVKRKGFTVEKIIFESRPKHFVTVALFLPENRDEKVPAVLLACGHARLAKGDPNYQRAAALLALNGIAALLLDPIDQGERMQSIDKKGKYPFWGTTSHMTLGVGSILLGTSTAQFMVWDGMRAIDYLQSRDDIDPNKIGCMGNSGGGTQTAYLEALDDRIKAASPSCYISSFPWLLKTLGAQDSEQTVFGQLAFGMDHADYLTMRAPSPVLICSATNDFFHIRGTWDSFREAKRVFSRLGYSERIDLIEHDAKHGYHQPQREAAAMWMVRWLLGKDIKIKEPEINILSEAEISCTPMGQVYMLPGAKTAYDLNDDQLKQFQTARKPITADRVRALAGIRPLANLPKPKVESKGTVQLDYARIEKLVLNLPRKIQLPALMFVPKQPKPGAPIIYLHGRGKTKDLSEIERLVKQGSTVLAIDLRGIGETRNSHGYLYATQFGLDGRDVTFAYLLGKSYVGMRAEDLLIAANYLNEGQPVRLVADGQLTVPALHAAFVEPQLFEAVKLTGGLEAWSHVIRQRTSENQFVNVVHGALREYDLPDLVKALKEKVTVERPLDAQQRPIPKQE